MVGAFSQPMDSNQTRGHTGSSGLADDDVVALVDDVLASHLLSEVGQVLLDDQVVVHLTLVAVVGGAGNLGEGEELLPDRVGGRELGDELLYVLGKLVIVLPGIGMGEGAFNSRGREKRLSDTVRQSSAGSLLKIDSEIEENE